MRDFNDITKAYVVANEKLKQLIGASNHSELVEAVKSPTVEEMANYTLEQRTEIEIHKNNHLHLLREHEALLSSPWTESILRLGNFFITDINKLSYDPDSRDDQVTKPR